MTELPVYVWVLVLAAAVSAPLLAAFVVKGRRGLVLGAVGLALAALAALVRPPIPIAVVVGVAATLAVLWRAQVTARDFATPQILRVVGGVFLIAMAHGVLPPEFALPAGLGDIAIGIAAPFAARGRVSLLWFNVLGLLDLVVALTLGALLQPSTLAAVQLPLILIPAALVPMALAWHIASIRRSLG